MTGGLTRIACVEDEQDIQVVLRIALETIGGYEPVMYSSGAEALHDIASHPPDLILLDVMMPGMDGREVLVRLKHDEASAGIPVVFLTAKAREFEIAEYIAAGAVAVITKPFDPVTLAARVEAIWGTLHA
jgi:CheY-like chemotaxis protein